MAPIVPDTLQVLSVPTATDILLDLPGVVTVARVYYPTYSEYEAVLYDGHDSGDLADMADAVPPGSMYLGSDCIGSEGQLAVCMRFLAAV